MNTKSIMIQGTGSNVGKSLIVAGLCRHFSNLGMSVRPFKPQNMSNNAAVAVEGGEIGRAQDLQALACRTEPSIHMNPVLLKPESDVGAQIIVHGKRWDTLRAQEYGKKKNLLLPKVLESFHKLQQQADLMIVEGAGSPAETNLRAGDIANMGFAEASDIPVILVGDIDRGGVIANMVGTHALLDSSEKQRIKGFLINRFRGDVTLFENGIREIENRTRWQSLGIMPWFDHASKLPAEDVLGLSDGRSSSECAIKIAVPVLNRIANFDDLDPLRMDSLVDLILVQPGQALPGDADLVLLLGTKSTIADLAFLRNQGWDIDIHAHIRRGGKVLGICGGLQMLGNTISDPDGIEGSAGTTPGLEFLAIETTLLPDKTVSKQNGFHLETGARVSGYEIHLGKCEGADMNRPFIEFDSGKNDGAVSPNGTVCGTYLHGLFTSDEFRQSYLKQFGSSSSFAYKAVVDETLDDLAQTMTNHLDLDRLFAIAANQTANLRQGRIFQETQS